MISRAEEDDGENDEDELEEDNGEHVSHPESQLPWFQSHRIRRPLRKFWSRIVRRRIGWRWRSAVNLDLELRSRLRNALLHTVHLALAYWIMFIVMTLNGYLILAVFLGVAVGSVVSRPALVLMHEY